LSMVNFQLAESRHLLLQLYLNSENEIKK
jgi:hypothetical protein